MNTSSDTAAATLAEIDRVRAHTRRTLSSIWYPLVVFGALTLVAGVVTFASDGAATLLTLVGYVGAWLLVSRHYRGTGLAADIRPIVRLWVAYPFITVVVSAFAYSLAGGRGALAANAILICALYFAFARVIHNRTIAVVGVVAGVVGVAIAAVGIGHEFAIARLGIGAVLVISGIYARTHEA